MPRPQFTIRALLVLLLSVACFFGGIRFEREWRRREDEANQTEQEFWSFSGGSRWLSCIAVIDQSYAGKVRRVLERNGIEPIISGSNVSVDLGQEERALSLLRKHADPRYWVVFGQDKSPATHD